MSREILQHVLGDRGAEEILAHPVLRSNGITVRARSLAASERPLSRISPAVGASKPASIISVVVLPDPEGPSSVKNSPTNADVPGMDVSGPSINRSNADGRTPSNN